MKTIFNEGKNQGITEVLYAKDKRVMMQKAIFEKYPTSTLVDVKMNIPGPIKNNRYLRMIFQRGISDLEKEFQKQKLGYKVVDSWDEVTGCENFYILHNKSNYVKKCTIDFEDNTVFGRLFDADVLIKNQKQALSRKELGLTVRKCFLCSKPAKDCARSRRHSVEELQQYISQLYFKNIF